ncbi:hypothetical protein AB6806_23775 [Bosea sp. RCC_152_1]|uniref:hypothetical protein n=1 Tax=Bosea sp. RCC_152_1 TaxID=3239228 RepID=UPI0035250CAC
MKLYSKDAQVGRFYIVKHAVNGAGGVSITGPLGAQGGYETYEDAEGQVASLPGKAQNDTFLVLQVVGEFKTKLQLVEVHASA